MTLNPPNLRQFIRKIEGCIIDILFPIECLGCGSYGVFLCTQCQSSLPRPQHQLCPICKHTSAQGMTCLDCLGKTSLDGVFVALKYQSPLVRATIQTLKYRFIPGCARPLTETLLIELHNAEIPLPHTIIPIPLHVRRIRWRGFNQAELIATHIAQHIAPGLQIPIDTTSLSRTRFTPPQATMTSKQERMENLHDAFAFDPLNPKQDVTGKTIWLIDDVATTLATLEACAHALKSGGAKKVIGIVLAR